LKVVHAIDWRKSFKEDKKHLNKEQQQQRIESLKQNLLTRLSSNPDGNVQSAFQKYDQNGQGTLNEEQFQQLMYDHGFQNKKDAKLLFDFFDQTKSKSIGYHVFIKELNVVVEETEETEETEEEEQQQQQQQQQNTNKYTVD
jgi:Ca2+-binding EF-hand superfamily protein